MDRGEFTKLSALALAGGYLPRSAYAGTNKPVGYAAVGPGRISDIFMRACANSQTAKITALVTGHPDTKGVKYSAMYGIPKSSIYTYETFDRIRENPDVDAIYVGLPNSMHAEYTIRGAQAGKHVLCEKPMAISSAECRKMIDACRQANVKLMIGKPGAERARTYQFHQVSSRPTEFCDRATRENPMIPTRSGEIGHTLFKAGRALCSSN